MNGFQKKTVLKALDNQDLLSEWEVDFVNSLADRDESKALSEKQNEILNRIQHKLLDR
jgi:hypothetical protein